MSPVEREYLNNLPKVATTGSTTSKNVDWDGLRDSITGNDLAYSKKDIEELSKGFSLIELEQLKDKDGESIFDEEGFPVMLPPISGMRARDFLVKEWERGRALKFRRHEYRKGLRVYYIFPLQGMQGKVRLGEEGCHPRFDNPLNTPEPKVIRGQDNFEADMLKRYRDRRKKEEKIVE